MKGVRYARGMPADGKPIMPSDIATAVNDMFDRHAVMPMTSDIGDCLFTAMEIENTALAAPGYYAGMGFGVPAGFGVAAATGRRPLILVGDGAFQMTGWELGNCRRYGLDPIVFSSTIELGDAARIPAGSRVQRSRRLEFCRYRGFDRRARGACFDAGSNSPPRSTPPSKRRGVFSLVEVMLPRGVTSKTLARFVKGFKAVRERAAGAVRPCAVALLPLRLPKWRCAFEGANQTGENVQCRSERELPSRRACARWPGCPAARAPRCLRRRRRRRPQSRRPSP